MRKRAVSLEGFPKGGPYSHATEAGRLIFVSGTGPVDPETNTVIVDDVRAATQLILKTIGRILEARGSSLRKVLKVNVYLRDMNDFQAMNESYAAFFPDQQPARTTVAVRELPFNFPIEIELMAVK
jgi:2-iminobutanoate/2-iminopropanoate deaminase